MAISMHTLPSAVMPLLQYSSTRQKATHRAGNCWKTSSIGRPERSRLANSFAASQRRRHPRGLDMLVIPAIDLKDGKRVRLKQGRMEDATTYGDDPVAIAAPWLEAGTRR